MQQPLIGEPLRQRYLAAMGITPWLPRQPLPGAAPSPQWEWQSVTTAAAASPAVNTSVPATAAEQRAPGQRPGDGRPGQALENIRALLGGGDGRAADATLASAPPQSPSNVAEPAPALPESDVMVSGAVATPITPVPAVTATPAAAIPRFRILLVRFDDCLVLNDLPLDAQQTVSPQHHQLLRAILAAVGLGAGSAQLRTLSWPMFAVDSGHEQGADVARMMLREEAGFDQLPAAWPLLLLGEQAGQHLLDDSERSAPVIRGPSLNEMLRIPTRKAELWRALQPLRGLGGESGVRG